MIEKIKKAISGVNIGGQAKIRKNSFLPKISIATSLEL
jgi:hypothetical protein